jgi:PmbA protein
MAKELESAIQEVLERSYQKADTAEVFAVSSQQTPVLFEANRLKLIESRDTSGLALRLIKDGRIGFSSTTNLKDLKSLVERALEISPFGTKALFEFPSVQEYLDIAVYDPHIPPLSAERMAQIGQVEIDNMRERAPDILWDAHVGKSVVSIHLANTKGGSANYTKTNFGLSLNGQLVRGDDMLFVGHGKNWGRFFQDTKDIRDTITRQIELSIVNAEAPEGQIPVIFTPRGLAETMLSPLLAGFNGKSIVQGTSPLLDKLDQQLFDPRLSLIDDPTTPFASGSKHCDDEGIPTQPLTLIDQGIATNCMYDLQTAAQAGKTSTGSASRGLSSLPGPSTSVLLMKPGDTNFDDMIKDVQTGLLVETLLGAGQGNMLGGDFSANVLLGYTIRNGKLVGRAKDTMIHGNVYKILQNIRAIGDTAEWVGGSLSLPYMSVTGVSVSTRKN